MNRLATLGLLLLVTGCAPAFTPAEADVRLVFKVGDSNTPVDAESLAAVKQVVEHRLRSAERVPPFVVETREPDELVVLTSQANDQQLAEIKDLVTRPGTLEFALLANSRDHAAVIAAAQASEAAIDPGDPPQYAWIPLSVDADGKPVEFGEYGSIAVREMETDSPTQQEVLVALDRPERRVTDKLLKEAYIDSSFNLTPVFGFHLNTRGGHLMKRMTASSLPASDGFKRRLGVILDGKLYAAPTINVAVESQGVIEGDYPNGELDRMLICFNAGRLPVPVRFVDDQGAGGE